MPPLAGTVGQVGIEAANAVEADEPGNYPVAPHLAVAAHAGGVVISGVAGKASGVARIASEPRPPVSSESQDLHQHRECAP
jgi:hypothetical protein